MFQRKFKEYKQDRNLYDLNRIKRLNQPGEKNIKKKKRRDSRQYNNSVADAIHECVITDAVIKFSIEYGGTIAAALKISLSLSSSADMEPM